MSWTSIAQAVLGALLVTSIGGGLVLWSDMRTLRMHTIPTLEQALRDNANELKQARAHVSQLRTALAVLEARSRKVGDYTPLFDRDTEK